MSRRKVWKYVKVAVHMRDLKKGDMWEFEPTEATDVNCPMHLFCCEIDAYRDPSKPDDPDAYEINCSRLIKDPDFGKPKDA